MKISVLIHFSILKTQTQAGGEGLLQILCVSMYIDITIEYVYNSHEKGCFSRL